MATFTIKELNGMLEVLDISTLDGINRGILCDPPYGYGLKPLLKYSPEALVEYGTLVYRKVIERLPLFRGVDNCLLFAGIEDQYLTQWIGHYKPVEEAFNSKSVEYASCLLAIAHTPLPPNLPVHIIEEWNVYEEIIDYFEGGLYDWFPQFNDFIYSKYSPLRRLELADQRLTDFIKEADDFLAPYNEALEGFISQELKCLRRAVNGCLRYAKLDPKDLDLLTKGKYPVPPELAQKIEGIIGKGSITATDLACVKDALKVIKKPPAPTPMPEPVETPTPIQSTLMPIDDYINFFIKKLAPAYEKYVAGRLKYSLDCQLTGPKFETVDLINLNYYGMEVLKSKYGDDYASIRANYDSTVASMTEAEGFYLDFNNLEPLLRACLQIDLNLVPIDKMFSTTTQEHGIIRALLKFTSGIKYSAKYRNLNFMYESTVKDLYDLMNENTKGFATALPAPLIEPLTDDTIATTPKVPRVTGTLLPFDLAIPIQQALTNLGADTITTSTEILSDIPDPTKLEPIDSQTIKNLAYYLTGQPSAPYLLNGELVIHNTIKDEYIKIIPTIREDCYSDYIFNACGHSTLSNRIIKLQRLLATSSACSNEVLYKYSPLPNDDLKARKRALEKLIELHDRLLRMVNEDFDSTDTEAQAELRQILKSRYYSTIYLSAHKLAAYTYYPAEYSGFISAKPINPETGEPLDYHINHVDGCRSNNILDNLEIISKQENMELRSTSRPVEYDGKIYNTITAYCERTEAGARAKLNERLSELTSKNAQIEFNGRLYSIDPTTGVITVTDGTQAPTIEFDGAIYQTIKEFADSTNLPYAALRQALSRATKQGKTDFIYKGYNFHLEDDGNIIINK